MQNIVGCCGFAHLYLAVERTFDELPLAELVVFALLHLQFLVELAVEGRARRAYCLNPDRLLSVCRDVLLVLGDARSLQLPDTFVGVALALVRDGLEVLA